MITKEDLKKEVDKLPENLLDEVYSFLKQILKKKVSERPKLTLRNFHGRLDNLDVRQSAYE